MSLDPVQERDEVHRNYAPLNRREVAGWGCGFVVLLVLDGFFSIDWWAYAGGVLFLISWEVTKYRLRRNADRLPTTRP